MVPELGFFCQRVRDPAKVPLIPTLSPLSSPLGDHQCPQCGNHSRDMPGQPDVSNQPDISHLTFGVRGWWWFLEGPDQGVAGGAGSPSWVLPASWLGPHYCVAGTTQGQLRTLGTHISPPSSPVRGRLSSLGPSHGAARLSINAIKRSASGERNEWEGAGGAVGDSAHQVFVSVLTPAHVASAGSGAALPSQQSTQPRAALPWPTALHPPADLPPPPILPAQNQSLSDSRNIPEASLSLAHLHTQESSPVPPLCLAAQLKKTMTAVASMP